MTLDAMVDFWKPSSDTSKNKETTELIPNPATHTLLEMTLAKTAKLKMEKMLPLPALVQLPSVVNPAFKMPLPPKELSPLPSLPTLPSNVILVVSLMIQAALNPLTTPSPL